MGLSLTAEQRNILKIFKIEEQFVIPAYQRPYSWGYDQCLQLYNDLMSAYNEGEEYFVGNIIIAKSDENKDILEVIDGQQRLTTLLIIIKVLYIFQPELKVLGLILEQEDWEGNEKKPRIKSDIFEAHDGHDLNSVLKYSKEDLETRFNQCTDRNGNIIGNKCNHRFEKNILYFFDWFSFYNTQPNYDIKKFISYLLKSVFLLPIELTGKTQEEANEKALVIFETINNRGMNLEDADIFKAKLYKKAKKIKEDKIFIERWLDFKNSCQNLNLEIDDIFRYYSHITRGKEGISSSEKNLREFFIRESFSPFSLKKYKEILDDLFSIIEALEFINTKKHENSRLSKWIQLIEIYTNQYPKFAVVVYLFVNGLSEDESLINFLRRLTRYVYYHGSTTRVKFGIYSIIKQISTHQEIDHYYKEVNIEYFEHLGRLKYGYALLTFYLSHEKAINNYSVDKIISLKDQEELTSSWDDINLYEIIDSLGNFVVLDLPKRNISLHSKVEYYNTSGNEETRNILTENFSYEDFKERDFILKQRLVDFFKAKDE